MDCFHQTKEKKTKNKPKTSVLFYKTKEKPQQKKQMRVKKTEVSYISFQWRHTERVSPWRQNNGVKRNSQPHRSHTGRWWAHSTEKSAKYMDENFK